MADVVLLSGVRTPIGKYLGGLAEVPATQLGALVIAEAMRRAGVPPERVEEVILGNVIQAGTGQSPARQSALKATLRILLDNNTFDGNVPLRRDALDCCQKVRQA